MPARQGGTVGVGTALLLSATLYPQIGPCGRPASDATKTSVTGNEIPGDEEARKPSIGPDAPSVLSDAGASQYRFREAQSSVGRCVPCDGRGRYDRPMSRYERDILERVALDCSIPGKRVRYVGALGVKGGQCAHAEPASHPIPKLAR